MPLFQEQRPSGRSQNCESISNAGFDNSVKRHVVFGVKESWNEHSTYASDKKSRCTLIQGGVLV